MLRSVAILPLALGLNCLQFMGLGPEKEDGLSDQQLLVLAFLLNRPQDECSGVASPVLVSAQGTGAMGGAAGSITGKLITSSGSAVVSAIVVAEVSGTQGITFWGTHTSIARDGTFLISGIPGGTSVKLGFEPVQSLFYNRVDRQIDCYMSPRLANTWNSFSSGWAPNTGSNLVTAKASGRTYTITSGAILDAGTILTN